MGRQINVEAHRLVGIAKHVGSRTWMRHIPTMDDVSGFTVSDVL